MVRQPSPGSSDIVAAPGTDAYYICPAASSLLNISVEKGPPPQAQGVGSTLASYPQLGEVVVRGAQQHHRLRWRAATWRQIHQVRKCRAVLTLLHYHLPGRVNER